MATIKEWRCALHGEFEGSHPICPHQPCDSAQVEREIRTAPKIATEMVRRHHRGMDRTAEIYALTDFRTAREGEVSKPPYESEFGTSLMWSDECQEKLGMSMPMMMPGDAKTGAQRLGDLATNNGMAAAATAAGITGLTDRAVPPSFDTTYAGSDAKSAAAANRLLPKGINGRAYKGKGRM